MDAVSEVDLTILYGSQTGNAEFLAYNISQDAQKRGLSMELMSFDEALAEERLAWNRLLIVTSTHDNGHLPENAEAFWSWLQARPVAFFSGLPYAVLAIGDSMYEDFCKAGQDYDRAFSDAGAVAMLERAECDVDYDITAQAWVKKFFAAVEETAAWQPTESVDVDPGDAEQFVTAAEDWHLVTIADHRAISGPGSEKTVHHLEIDLPADLTYCAGDSLEVTPRNSPQLTDEWEKAFPNVGTVLLGGEEVPFREALRDRLELRIPHIGLINALCARIPSSETADRIRDLLDSGDRQEIDSWLWGRDILAIVDELGLTGMDPQALIDTMRPLQHRSYSISSSPLRQPGRLSLTVSEIDYFAHGREHLGAGSSNLADTVGREVWGRRLVARDFRLPEDDAPIIMIGPGVGVAPFIGFLQEVEQRGGGNDTWLFFGAQHRATDFLYEEELEAWQRSGVLNRLSVAFSRDQQEKHYVQHELLKHAGEVRAWIERGAHLYICGDKNHMAHDVESAITMVLGGEDGDAERGRAALEALRFAGRYAKDVY